MWSFHGRAFHLQQGEPHVSIWLISSLQCCNLYDSLCPETLALAWDRLILAIDISVCHWQDKLDRCYELLDESSGRHLCSLKNGHKRKLSIHSSPSGVFNASFSSESSNDSWAVDSSLSSPRGPSFKRSQTQDHRQQAGLPLPSLRQFLQGCFQ